MDVGVDGATPSSSSTAATVGATPTTAGATPTTGAGDEPKAPKVNKKRSASSAKVKKEPGSSGAEPSADNDAADSGKETS